MEKLKSQFIYFKIYNKFSVNILVFIKKEIRTSVMYR